VTGLNPRHQNLTGLAAMMRQNRRQDRGAKIRPDSGDLSRARRAPPDPG
jgi:hypothetical protein